LIVLVGLELAKLQVLVGGGETYLAATSGGNDAVFPQVATLGVLVLLRHDDIYWYTMIVMWRGNW
jgi:hypothetical protein